MACYRVWLVLCLPLVLGESRRSWGRTPRLVNIYTNHDNFEEVIKHYGEIRGRKLKDRVDGDLESEFGEIVDLKPNDLIVINTNKYTVAKTPSIYEKIHNGDEDVANFNVDNLLTDKRPKFKTQKNNWTYIEPPIVNDREMVPINSTKKEINDMLKSYLSKLYMKKYNSTNFRNVEENKSKLLNDAISGFKNKTMKIANKFFSLFQVVQFSNSRCTATSSAGEYQGVCYHQTDCTRMNGTALGNCANGYGVCCVFINTCGGSSNQNCTYFQSPNYPNYYPSNGTTPVIPTTEAPAVTPDPRWKYYHREARQQSDILSCVFNVYKLNNNITQMRIDFLDLELLGPTNGTCVNERLVISGQNVNDQIPVLCGYNTGQHIYVDVSMLNGPLQLSVLSTVVAQKRWRIRVCQFTDSCTNNNCLQYYTGVSGVITSFNYDQNAMYNRSSAQYLNNLNYAICIRKEAGYCSITYSNVANGMEYPFQMNNVDEFGNRTVPQGQAGADIINCPDDYIILDGVRLCGDKLNDGTLNANFTQNAPITDSNAGPIVIPVRTDGSVTGLGFKIFYMQNLCTSI